MRVSFLLLVGIWMAAANAEQSKVQLVKSPWSDPIVARLVDVGPLSEKHWTPLIYGLVARDGLRTISLRCLAVVRNHPLQMKIRNELMVVYDRYLSSADVQTLVLAYEKHARRELSNDELLQMLRPLVADPESIRQTSSATRLLGAMGLSDNVARRFQQVNSLAKISVNLILGDDLNQTADEVLSCEKSNP